MDNELQKIINKAHSLYIQFGIKSVSMDDISRELTMSKKTLYQHIKDKKDLVRKVLQFEKECKMREFQKFYKEGKNAIDQMIQVYSYLSEAIKNKQLSFEYDLEKYYPDLYEIVTESKKQGMYNGILENIVRGKKEGIYRKDLNSEIIAGLYITRFSSSHFLKFIHENEISSVEIHREIMIYHLRGLANSKGLNILEKKIENNEI